MQAILIVAIILLISIIALLIWLISSNFNTRKDLAGQSGAILLLQQQLESLKASQDGTRQAIAQSLQTSQVAVTQSLQSSQETLSKLHNQIGQIQTASAQMQKVGEQVKRLEDILASPKLRGQMGEFSLQNLLSMILPKDSYELQYSFKDGRIVDALVKMAGYSVSIDAKFPLSAFDRLMQTQSDDEKTKQRKQFLKDVAGHIDKIASSYIRPAEGTLDFAMMYIPAENVYYETVVKHDGDTQDIMQYCLDKKVIPVSPNLLYAYLMTVVMGLHGLQIEKQAAEIRQNLKKLNADFAAFSVCWEVLGKHLRNAGNQYDEGSQKLTRFSMQLTNIQFEPEGKMLQ